MSRVIGLFLCAIGLGFIGLFLFLKARGELSGDVKVSAVMVSCGVGLIWISSNWLISRPLRTRTEPNETIERRGIANSYWLKLRRPGEVIAATGCAAMLANAATICTHAGGLPNWLLAIILGTAVVLAWLILRILVPGAFPSDLFPEAMLLRMSTIGRFLINLLMSAGWCGYVGILFIWFHFDVFLPPYWRVPSEILASALVSLLFASQLLLLHYGQFRQTSGDN